LDKISNLHQYNKTMPTPPLQPLLWGVFTYLIAILILYFMTGEIRWKFAFWLAVGTTLGNILGNII